MKKRTKLKKKIPVVVKLHTEDKKEVVALMPGAYLQVLQDKPIKKVEVIGEGWETLWKEFLRLFR